MITYADIEEIYFQEKRKKGELQKIDENFYSNLSEIYDSSKDEYLKNLGEGIFVERVQKILIDALRGSIGNTKPLENMTKEEKELYENVVKIIKTYKDKILFKKIEREKEIPKVKVKFLNACPGIVDTNLQKNGPFNIGDVGLIDKSLAKILIKNGFCEPLEV